MRWLANKSVVWFQNCNWCKFLISLSLSRQNELAVIYCTPSTTNARLLLNAYQTLYNYSVSFSGRETHMTSERYHTSSSCNKDVDDLHPVKNGTPMECKANMTLNVSLNDGER